MLIALVISAAAVLLAVVALFLAMRRSGSDKTALPALETRLMGRLDSVLEGMGRWRDEGRSAVQDKVRELYEGIELANRASRGEMLKMLDQFRAELENYREVQSVEQQRNRQESRDSIEGVARALSEQFEKLQASSEQKLTEIHGEVDRKLSETIEHTGRTFDKVTERLSDLRVTNERIIEFSKDLHELQFILQAPRMRGEMGETEMEQMLRQCLAPHQFSLQHAIEGGRVDAVIFNPEGSLPIDCKFPLEAWRRVHDAGLPDDERQNARRMFVKAVKTHLECIAEKYIRPPETLEFAIMYIPVEGVYYEIIESVELAEHARRCRVMPASPLTFWALLQVIVMGFRGMQISENARHVNGLLIALRDDMQKFREAFRRATVQVENANRNLADAARQLERVDMKLGSLHAASESAALPQPSPEINGEPDLS